MQPPVIEANVSAIKYFHSIVGYNIGESTIFKHVLEAKKKDYSAYFTQKRGFNSRTIT